MNNNDLYSVDFTRSLPPALQHDPKMIALAKAVAEQLHITAQQIRQNIIYARIDELDEQTLDILAYDLHVDWYDYTYPIEVKRATIKDSVKVHRRLGTKYAVETALGAVFPGTKVEEWFEYGGAPYTFRVVIGATSAGVSADQQEAVLERVRFYKNLRSHLGAISYKIEQSTTVHVGGFHAIGTRLEVYPYLARGLEEETGLLVAAVCVTGRRLEVYPPFADNFNLTAGIRPAAFTLQTQRIAIHPDPESSGSISRFNVTVRARPVCFTLRTQKLVIQPNAEASGN